MSVVDKHSTVVVVDGNGRSPVELMVLRNISTMVDGNVEIEKCVSGNDMIQGNLNSRKGFTSFITPGV